MSTGIDAARSVPALLEALLETQKANLQAQTAFAEAQKATLELQKTIAEGHNANAETQKLLAEALNKVASTQSLMAGALQPVEAASDQVTDGVTRVITTVEGFPKFRALPPEIRQEIWKMALPPPQIYEPYFNASIVKMRFKYPSRPPPMRGACKEAWDITEATGVFALDYSWFNTDRDIIFLSEDDPGRFDMTYSTLLLEIPEAQHVALDWFGVANEPDKAEAVLEHLRDCKTVIMAVSITTLQINEFPHFFSLRDQDPVEWKEYAYATEFPCDTWHDAKKAIMKIWSQYAEANSIPLHTLPKLEGVEVLWKSLPRGDISLRVNRSFPIY
ncbi:hypothetical protein ACHAQA_002355 [Verticillium albo-atrum]